jgi:GT2 family glycosyltransferase
MMSAPLSGSGADVIIPVRNQYCRTRNLLESIYRCTDSPFHLYVIDNASTDETVDLHKIYTRDITVTRNRRNRGWSYAVNQGVKMGRNPYVALLSNEVDVSRGWLGNMCAFLDTHPRIGAVGPLVSNMDGWQNVDRVRETIAPQIPEFLNGDLHEQNRILEYHFHRAGILIEGALAFFCVVLKRRAIEEAGPLDETALRGSEAYCRRLRKAGYVLGLSLDTCIQRR